MKTSLTLTILGGYQTLMGLVAMTFASSMGEMVLAEPLQGNAQMVELATNMHWGVGQPFFMIGLLLLAARKSELAVAKNILIAYLIGVAVMFGMMLTILAPSEVMNFSPEMMAPDILLFVLAIFGFVRAK